MQTSGENPNETPILDGLLADFHLVGLTMHLSTDSMETQKVKKELGGKAAIGSLTREDIERGLQSIPEVGGREDQQKSILAYLACNYREVFIQTTGHNPF